MISFSDGSKGGTGKSLMTAIILAYLIHKNIDPVLIETDNSNPDVFLAYKDYCTAKTCKLDTDSNWADFLTLIYEHKNREIVVNCAARNQDGIKKWWQCIEQLKEPYRSFWTINKEKDSILLLQRYDKIVDPKAITIVKNGFFGDEDEFVQYDQISDKSCYNGTIFIKKLPSRSVSKFYSQRIPLHKIAESLSMGDRIMYEMWLCDSREKIARSLS